GALEHFPNRDKMIREGLERTPAGRLVEPEDVAGVVAYLASADAEMVRGHTLVGEGGFSLVAWWRRPSSLAASVPRGAGRPGAGVAPALRRGGELLLHDAHPVLDCLDDMLHWREDYFAAGRQRVGEVVTAVASVGLVVESLEELPAERPLLPQARRAPGELLVVARKP